MKLQVQRWGNSLALRIPKSIALDTNIEQGTTVELTLEEGNIVVKPVTARAYTLDELLAGITKQNRHEEVSSGKAQGREVW
jgi:antitoxin MazE